MIRCHIVRTPNRKPRISRIFFYITHLLFFLIFSVAYAGEYHNSAWKGAPADTLACSQCHSMHNSQGGVSMQYGGGVTPQPKLLRASSILELCKYCHGTSNPGGVDSAGRFPPPVYNAYNQKSYVPSAGDFADSNVDTNEANRHSVGTDVSAMQPPGYTGNWTNITNRFSTTFNCIYCHDQHGNANYRNLRYDPGNPGNDSPTNANRVEISYLFNSASMPNDNTKDVNYYGPNVGTNPNKFSRGNVAFRRAPADNDTNPVRGISAWCGRCHTKFYGISATTYNETTGPYLGGEDWTGVVGPGDDNDTTGGPWLRHPVGDINIYTPGSADLNQSNLHADRSAATQLANNVIKTADYDGTRGNGDDQPFCLSCHYAHGGGNPGADQTLNHSNLVKIDAEGDLNIGDTTNYNTATPNMRNVCNQCHNQ